MAEMRKPLSPWTEEDLKNHKALDELLSKNVKWEGSTAEIVQAYRSLVWFAQLREKIKGGIAEITKVYNPAEEKAKAEARAEASAASAEEK